MFDNEAALFRFEQRGGAKGIAAGCSRSKSGMTSALLVFPPSSLLFRDRR
jgi:hypothetical protein